jgi:hypothetical protein
VVGRACCRHAYVRGAFLGGGSVSGPRAPHLEIRSASRAAADLLAAAAAADDVVLRVQDRGAYTAVYAKSAEAVADVLALAGAGDAALALDEHAVVAEARARANRVANADHANLVRSSRAAHRQITAIRELEAEGARATDTPAAGDRRAAATLPSAAARARREVPPADDESGCHRRLGRLVALADRARLASQTRSFCCPNGSYSARRVCSSAGGFRPVCRLGPGAVQPGVVLGLPRPAAVDDY